MRRHVSNKYLPPRTLATPSWDRSRPVSKYSVSTAAKTADRSVLVHIVDHRQSMQKRGKNARAGQSHERKSEHSFSGMRSAKEAMQSEHSLSSSRTVSSSGGTKGKLDCLWFHRSIGDALESEGVPCILLSDPTIDRVFFSNSCTLSLIFCNSQFQLMRFFRPEMRPPPLLIQYHDLEGD